MILFSNLEGEEKSASYDKGGLFEDLLEEIVDALGYRDIKKRVKTSGKEYDLQAIAKLGGRLLVGQAKAWQKTIEVSVISEFVGSLDNKKYPKDTFGLFFSLSNLTADAEDYLDNLQDDKANRIEVIAADKIFERLEDIGYPSQKLVKHKAEQIFQHTAGDTHLLVSNRGNYFVQLLIRHGETRPKAFCIFDKKGILITEATFGKEIKQRVDVVQELNFLTKSGDFDSILDIMPGLVSPGLEGANWFEYKLPAPPDFFIGRNEQISHFQNFLADVESNHTASRVYQVLSPSGVGKTSFVLKLQSVLEQPLCSVLEDARNYRSPIDLLWLLQNFLKNCIKTLNLPFAVPTDTISVLNAFPNMDRELQNRRMIGVIFVDQFESLFLKPDLYTQLLDFISKISHDTKRIVFCISRRNDQPTTFDDRKDIDLDRLVGMSRSIELTDFSRQEALILLSHLSDEIGQQSRKKLINLVLEFAVSGFPWLCKRAAAHVCDSVKKGVSQEELIQNGIKPDELFAEDLSEIDLIDREFLKELAKYLPATLDDLSQRFDGKRLAKSLQSFQNKRLIRLIGRTYDTYSDVFKEYLKTGKVPLPTKYVFRSSVLLTRNALNTIISQKCENKKDLFPLIFGIKHRRTIDNLLYELRMLGIAQSVKGHLYVEQDILEAFRQGNLDILFRDRILNRNGLVQDILNKMAAQDNIDIEQMITYLKESLPLLEASEKSWRYYARTFAKWLLSVGLVPQGRIILKYSSNRGNSIGYPIDEFLPSSYINEMVKLLKSGIEGNYIQRDEKNDESISDCLQLGFVHSTEVDEMVKITEEGQQFILNELDQPRKIRTFLESLPYTSNYIEIIQDVEKKHSDVLKATLKDHDFTEHTWEWRSRVFASWLEFSGLITRRKGRVLKSYQTSLFEFNQEIK